MLHSTKVSHFSGCWSLSFGKGYYTAYIRYYASYILGILVAIQFAQGLVNARSVQLLCLAVLAIRWIAAQRDRMFFCI